jgi:hypothetical protein
LYETVTLSKLLLQKKSTATIGTRCRFRDLLEAVFFDYILTQEFNQLIQFILPFLILLYICNMAERMQCPSGRSPAQRGRSHPLKKTASSSNGPNMREAHGNIVPTNFLNSDSTDTKRKRSRSDSKFASSHKKHNHPVIHHMPRKQSRITVPECTHHISKGFLPSVEDVDLAQLYQVDREPPITKQSMAELDIVRIINNSKLRHDLNFQKEVNFSPCHDRKRILAKQYWEALAFELSIYMFHATNTSRESDQWLEHMVGNPRAVGRLPEMFRAIRDILKTLIRSDDWTVVDQVLDVDLLMQQLRKGACDLVALSSWLGGILKGSCSPIRDSEVERVIGRIQKAVFKVDPVALVSGIEHLFALLETMKLVGNSWRTLLGSTDLPPKGCSKPSDSVFAPDYDQRQYRLCPA